MIFNSIDFLVFVVIIIPLYFIVSSRYRWILLLVASYFFYMYWRPEFIILIIVSTLVDYYCGLKMSNKQLKEDRLPYLFASLISNLGLLFTFKYLDFFSNSFNQIFGTSIPVVDLILPMGISFYTFQTLSYSIDIYNGKVRSEKHLGKFALYVSFFPQLVAGPIERSTYLLPQFRYNKNRFNAKDLVFGLTKVVIGFFKKVVVADSIALYVNSVYGNYEYNSGLTFWMATYLFAIQIYCDFSGYSDIAIGISRIMGYNLMENFRQPYFSKSITEFWQRWHISLSTWLRDYLYIPLGGNQISKLFTYRNLMITMLLGGLWHGASWNFIIWGALNGMYLSIERILNLPKWVEKKGLLIKVLCSIIVFHLICITWVFFRAETFNGSITILTKMFSYFSFGILEIKDTGVFASIIFSIIVLVFLEFSVINKIYSREVFYKKIGYSKSIIINAILIILILIFGISEGSQFIYFQF